MPEVLLSPSPSPLVEVYNSEEFKDDAANDVRFHVARNLLYLRRYRGMSQTEVGRAMGTSQSAIARIESGQENITLDTLQRHIVGLDGRLLVSIYPKECAPQPMFPWWEAVDPKPNPWKLVVIVGRRTSDTYQVLVGMERPHGTFTDVTFEGSTMLPSGETFSLERVTANG